jgi:hypothetical protein
MPYKNKSFERNKNSLYSKIANHNPFRRYADSVRFTYSPNKQSQVHGYNGFLNLNYDLGKFESSLTNFTIFGSIKFTKSPYEFEGNKEVIIVTIKYISLDFYECICDLYSKIDNNNLGLSDSIDLNLFHLLESNPDDKTFGTYGNTLIFNIGKGIKYFDINGDEHIIKSKNSIPLINEEQIMELKLIPKRLKYKIENNKDFSMFIQLFSIKLTNLIARNSDLEINEINFSDN